MPDIASKKPALTISDYSAGRRNGQHRLVDRNTAGYFLCGTFTFAGMFAFVAVPEGDLCKPGGIHRLSGPDRRE